MEDFLYNQFISTENFLLAYKRLQTASRGFYKKVYYNDLKNFGTQLQVNIESLIDSIKANTYEPNDAYRIYLPKQSGTVRPVTVINFVDLLVYQAIIGVLSDFYYPRIKHKYNRTVFGNIYNYAEEAEKKIFFYVPWKKQWKEYEYISKCYYRDGFKYLSEFDLASFYDTVDHSILQQILEYDTGKSEIFNILFYQLSKWSHDNERNHFYSKHGIPQGPIASGFLSEILLDYIDKEMTKKIYRECNIGYIRYVDDIRLFAKNEKTSMKYLAYLDLLSRDLGLIPQGSKICIKLIENEHDLSGSSKLFSNIDSTIKTEGKLSQKYNTKLLRKLKSCLSEENLKDKKIDKTILKFALYRIDKDDEIKDILIKNWKILFSFIDEICFYLYRHFKDTVEVKQWIDEVLTKDSLPYDYINAIIFKHFYNSIDYNKKLFDKFYRNEDRKHWYVRYYMIKWLSCKNPAVLNFLQDDINPITNKQLYYYKYVGEKDIESKILLIETMLNHPNVAISLLGYNLYIYDSTLHSVSINSLIHDSNRYIKKITNKQINENYISKVLKDEYLVQNSEKFFNTYFWNKDELQDISIVLNNAESLRELDPSAWLIYMDCFNHLVIKKLIELSKATYPNPKEYSNMLDTDYIKSKFPITHDRFLIVHRKRNETPPAHPFTDRGKIGKLIKFHQVKFYHQCLKEGWTEIIDIYEGIYYKEYEETAATSE